MMAMALVTLQVVKSVPSSTLLWGAQVILMLCAQISMPSLRLALIAGGPTARPRPCIRSSPRRCHPWEARPWASQSCRRCSGAWWSLPWPLLAAGCRLRAISGGFGRHAAHSLRRSPRTGSPGPPSCKQERKRVEGATRNRAAATRRNTQRGALWGCTRETNGGAGCSGRRFGPSGCLPACEPCRQTSGPIAPSTLL